MISETGGGGYGVSGQVEIQLSYESERDRAWVDAIRTDDSSSVQLVSFDENKRTINAALGCSFEIGVKSDDGEHTVAKLTIPLGQSNFIPMDGIMCACAPRVRKLHSFPFMS